MCTWLTTIEIASNITNDRSISLECIRKKVISLSRAHPTQLPMSSWKKQMPHLFASHSKVVGPIIAEEVAPNRPHIENHVLLNTCWMQTLLQQMSSARMLQLQCRVLLLPMNNSAHIGSSMTIYMSMDAYLKLFVCFALHNNIDLNSTEKQKIWIAPKALWRYCWMTESKQETSVNWP